MIMEIYTSVRLVCLIESVERREKGRKKGEEVRLCGKERKDEIRVVRGKNDPRGNPSKKAGNVY